MTEKETDGQQIRGAEKDYKAGRFARVRELARQGEKALISLIRDEIKAIDNDVVFGEYERTLYCNYYNSWLNVYFEDGTFAVIKHNFIDGIVSGKCMRISDMVEVIKTYGFTERET